MNCFGVLILRNVNRFSVKISIFSHFQMLIKPEIGSIPLLSLLDLVDSPPGYQILPTDSIQLGGAFLKKFLKIDFSEKYKTVHSYRC